MDTLSNWILIPLCAEDKAVVVDAKLKWKVEISC